MTNTEVPIADGRAQSLAQWGLVSAVLGVAAVVVMYWLVVPAVLFGLTAVILGLIAHRRAALTGWNRDMATAAVCLGAAAVLFTPVVLMQTAGAEDWGRDCALHPERDENCPQPAR